MKRMLVALDGSARKHDVLGAAIALGRKTGAKLVLFRSVGIPRELPEEAYSLAPDAVPELLHAAAMRELESLQVDVPNELRGPLRVLIGAPWQTIERVAVEEDVDLIVIGSHGYEGADRLLGTTAAKVVNHADRAVLVVRAPDRLNR